MPRENEDYRYNLEHLIEYFGRNHNHLSQKDVAEYMGLDRRTVLSRYGVTKDGITLPSLARRMCHH